MVDDAGFIRRGEGLETRAAHVIISNDFVYGCRQSFDVYPRYGLNNSYFRVKLINSHRLYYV